MIVAFDAKRLADNHRYDLHNFGISVYARELVTRLSAAYGADLSLVVDGADDPDIGALERSVECVERQFGRPVVRGWRTRYLPGASALAEAIAAVPRGRRFARPVARAIERLRHPRVPIANGWELYHSPVTPLPSRLVTGHAQRILTVHDVLHLKFPHWSSDGAATLRRTIDSIDAGRDWVVCDSKSSLDDLRQLKEIPDSRAHVVPLAASATFASPSPQIARALLTTLGLDSGSYLLALGQPDPRKNITLLIEAFVSSLGHGSSGKLVLVLAIASRDADAFRKQLAGMAVPPDSCRLAIDLSNEQLAALYANACCFVYPSLYEGFGIPLLEAMMAGCPVISSDRSSLPEVGGDAPLYVDPVSRESLTAAMDRVVRDQDLRQSLRERGRRQSANFSWDKTASRTMAIYEQAAVTAVSVHS